ncbi:MAG: hypothetical protein B6D39_09315 [Anaerolineae bacterium UTCFX2]|jgi:EmrB/QacA subfamily drug resistance transporter|nr:MFS transporter [Anaerolineae bacterium]OQY89669.1 MAG: hypothetical protein B6D39_09315 [Anaerolineae bacterium UTCFX2]
MNHGEPASRHPLSSSQPDPFQENPSRKWWILLAIGIGTFMSALDGSVVNIILPVLKDHFISSVSTVEWVVTIYLLVLSGVLLGFGRLGDLHGHKRIYLSGFGVFLLGSFFCGLAPSIEILIFFRAVQALGASVLQANSPAILTSSFPGRQRGQALGLQATMTYLGLTVGPSLGGWLTDQFSWRAVFYINIPVGITAFILSLIFIRADAPSAKRVKFDFLGAGLFMVGLVLLIFSLNQGYLFGWTSWLVLGPIILSVLALGGFWMVERRAENPMLDLSLFSSRVFSSSVVSAVINYIGVYSITFLMPFYLIQGMGFTPSGAGLVLTAMPIVMAIAAPLSGSISDRIGTWLPALAGMSMLSLGLYLLSGLTIDSSLTEIVIRLAFVGLGIGVFISPNTSALMGAAPRHRQGIASGVLATARNAGMALGVALAGAVFTTVIGTAANPSALETIAGFQTSMIVAAAICALGIFTTAFRSEKRAASP